MRPDAGTLESPRCEEPSLRHEIEIPETDGDARAVKVHVAAGDEAALVLSELGAAGYVWEVLEASPHVTCTKEPVATPTKRGQVGGPNGVRFVLAPTAAGTTVTTLVHRRPWSPADEAGRVVVTMTRA